MHCMTQDDGDVCYVCCNTGSMGGCKVPKR
jgi:hypothetical protein